MLHAVLGRNGIAGIVNFAAANSVLIQIFVMLPIDVALSKAIIITETRINLNETIMYGDDIIYKEQEHRGYTCKVVYDPDPTSPDDWDTLGTIYANSRNYNPQNHRMDEIVEADDEGGWHVNKDYIYVKIYAYIHSGIALSCSRSGQFADQFDSTLFGLMAVRKDKAAEEFGDITNADNYEKVMKCLEGEVECWDMYYQGEVFGYKVLDEDDNEVNSCWGFYGYEGADEAMQEGIGIIDAKVDEQERQEAEEAARIQYYEMITEPFWID